MRLLLLQNLLYLPSHGGANKANRLLLEQLAARGHECRAVAPARGLQGCPTPERFRAELATRGIGISRSSRQADVFHWNGVEVHAVRETADLPSHVAAEIRDFSPDCVLVTSEDPEQTVLEVALQGGAPVVYLAHTTMMLPFGDQCFRPSARGRKLLARADGMISVSRFLQGYLQQAGIASRVLRFPVYGQGPFPRAGEFGRGSVLLLNAGAVKGAGLFLELARRFPEVPFMTVAGWATTSADREALGRLPNVEVLEAGDDVERLYARARVLLAPSLVAEAFGYVAVEAMLRGIPVLASDRGGLPEAKLGVGFVLPVRGIDRWEEALDTVGNPVPVVPPQDVEPWAAVLRLLLSDRTRYEELAETSRAAASRFAATATAEPFETYLREVAAVAPSRQAGRQPSPDRPKPSTAELSSQAKAVLALRALRQQKKGPGTRIPARPRGPGRNRFPLSFAQERLWMLGQLEPGNPAYNESAAVRLAGALDIGALAGTLREIGRRHEALRTTFEESEGEPVQVISPTPDLALRRVDLRTLPHGRREAELRSLITEESRRPFDLAAGPLLRPLLLTLDDREHALLVVAHHIVCDGWSLGIFVKELTVLYGAFVAGSPSPLPELRVQYADFAVWQRERLRSGELDRQLLYWRRQLEGGEEILDLPRDRPRAPVQSFRGGSAELLLDPPLWQAVEGLCGREGVTPFIVLLAALSALLSRYTGQVRILLGSPIAGRGRPEAEGLIGFFLNVLVLRCDLRANPGFRQLVQQARQVALEAYQNQDVPFERLIQELRPERDLGRTPFFQVLLNMLNLEFVGGAGAGPDLPGVRIEPLEMPDRGAKFDLTLYAVRREGGLLLRAVYNADLFEPVQAASLLRHLRSVLRQGTADPDRRMADLALDDTPLAPDRSGQPSPAVPFVEFSAAEVEQSIVARFHRQVDAGPGRPAILMEGAAWTYEELSCRASRVARAVLAAGPRVALLFEPGAPMIAAMLGVLQAGGAYVPLDPAFPAARLRAILEDARCGAILVGSGLRPLAAELARDGAHRLIDEELLEEGPAAPSRPVAPDAPAYLLYTSGSTGEPKGVVQCHRNVLHHIRAYTNALRIHPGDRLSLLASYGFDASVMDIYGALLNGATLVPFDLRRRSFQDLAATVAGITIYHSTPSVYRLFLASVAPGTVFDTVRLVVLGGEEAQRRDLDLFRRCFPERCLFVNGLGPTESTLALQFFADHRTKLRRGTVPVGFPVQETEVLLMNDTGRQEALYGTGEIVIASRYLALGYWDREEATRAAFLSGEDGRRRYRTGDLGRLLPGGCVEFIGRRDNQVKIRGYRVELGEVEDRIREIPGIREVVVAARPAPSGDRRLVAYFVPAAGAGPEPARIREHLRSRLPEPMVPAVFVALEELPLTATGKVDRRRLPEPEPERADPAEEFQPPATPVERQVAAIWSEVLGVERVGLDDGFFDRGGHSLLAIQVVSRIRQALGVELPLRRLFESPTLRGMAAAVGEARPPLADFPLIALPRAARPKPLAFPLSFGQQRLWFLDQLQPGNPAYLVPRTVRFTGALRPEVLERSLDEVARRHEVLRTHIATFEGTPVQVVSDRSGLGLSRVDLTALPAREREVEALRIAAEEARRPFALDRGPLARAALVRLGPTESLLLLVLHHAITDGWSTGVLVREATTLYQAFASDHPPSLPELSVQYGDYAVWQRERLQGELLEELLAYWRRQLASVAVLSLPTDRARPAIQDFRGCRLLSPLPESAAAGLRSLARERGTAPFMVAFAAFNTLLHRYSGDTDIAVGTPVAGRNRLEIEDLIGFFVNTLVLRTDLSGSPGFHELIARVQEVTLGAYSHQDLPFEKLVEELKPERDLSRSPLFQVMFVFQGSPAPVPELPGIGVELLDIHTGAAQFDLTLTLAETPAGFTAALDYSAGAFEEVTAGRLMRHFHRLLAAAAASPDLPLGDLPLLSHEERRQLLVEWAGRTAEYAGAETLHGLVEAQVARTPDAVAVSFENEDLSYRELDRRAGSLARALRRLGAGPENLVGLYVERSLEMMVALLAILKAGSAFLPLDTESPPERLEFIVRDAGLRLVLAQKSLTPTLAAAEVVLLDADGFLADLPAEPETGSVVLGENLAYALYTSGSTGRPKGALNTHWAIRNRLLWMQEAYGLKADDRVLQKTPYTFDVSVWEFFWPLIAGARLVVARPGGHQDAAYLVRTVAEREITTLHFVPAMLHAFLGEEDLSACGVLRRVLCSGEALPLELERRFFERLGCELHNLYGPTEAAVDVTAWACRRDSRMHTVPIGHPIANARIYLVDRELRPMPPGAPGELCIGGVAPGRGYLHRPDLTAERFVPDPFGPESGRLYRTGDLARHLPGGAIEFLGRLDHQVKIRGLRIELGEIESRLLQHPAVRQAAVAVGHGVAGQPRLVAYWVAVADARAGEEELRDFLREWLPDYMLPGVFMRLDSLPQTASGKVDRRALPEPAAGGERHAFVAPRSAVERLLASLWHAVLRVETIGAHDNFFQLGGDSILSIQLVARARRAGLTLTPRQIFQHQTLAELAAVAGTAPATREDEGQAVGPVPLTPVQQWFFEQELVDAHHFNQSVLLEYAMPLDPGRVARSLDGLIRHHDALRLSFPREDGKQRQVASPPDGRVPLTVLDLTALPPARAEAALDQASAQAQTALRLDQPPLLRAVLFRGAGPDRLLLAVHHLAVDAVSWRILVEDLEILDEALAAGREPVLPPRTTSFKTWAEKLVQHAGSPAAAREGDYWVSEARESEPPGLPRELPGGANRSGSVDSVIAALEEEETELLRHEIPKVYSARIEEILLTGLAQALASWTGSLTVRIDAEGHGREDLFDDVDLSRTVGWFTSIYPVRLTLPPVAGALDALNAVKEALRRVTNRGIGYGILRYLCPDAEMRTHLRRLQGSDVLFNYLGQLDLDPPGSPPFRVLQPAVPTRSPRNRRSHLVEVVAGISQGRLHTVWTYSREVHRRRTIERVTGDFLAALRTLLHDGGPARSGGLTAADFPLANLAGANLDAIFEEVDFE
ncbi:MAG TPA: amino acid adenylation domain-containing protein [Thermoanaerobaculia bacterium]|nr:amino acid adenylation domain-containing protein [Thermoanaerobaculia bacterium]